MDYVNNKLLPRIMKFTSNRPITALKNGMIYSIPFIIVGSVFLILASLPVKAWAAWMASTGLVPYFIQAYSFSFNVMSLIAAAGIAYEWAKAENVDPLAAGLTSLLSFLIVLQPASPILSATGKVLVANPRGITGWIDTGFLGGRGMVAAIIVGLVTGWIYSWFVTHHITIKLPEQVPANVTNSFVALIPAAVLITGWMLVYMGFDHFLHEGMISWIYGALQVPLQGVTDSLGGVITMSLAISLLWFFGVHGAAIVQGLMTGILMSNSTDNAALFRAGKALTVANGGHIVTQALLDQFGVVTGTGLTFGLLIYVLFFARSVQLKALGAIEVAPALFNINEPFMFGIPLVMNPVTLIPFAVVPALSMTLTYWAIQLGFLSLFNGVYVPWTTPPIFSGFMVGGWKMAVWQGVMLFMSVVVYFPFIRSYDRTLAAQEAENLAAETAAK